MKVHDLHVQPHNDAHKVQPCEVSQPHNDSPNTSDVQVNSLHHISLVDINNVSLNLHSDQLKKARQVVFHVRITTSNGHPMHVRVLLSSKLRIHELAHGSLGALNVDGYALRGFQYQHGNLRDLCNDKDKTRP